MISHRSLKVLQGFATRNLLPGEILGFFIKEVFKVTEKE
jgi:hypothetical protein